METPWFSPLRLPPLRRDLPRLPLSSRINSTSLVSRENWLLRNPRASRHRWNALASLPPFLSIRPPPGSQIPATTKLPLTLRAALIPQPRLAGTRPARSGGPCQAGEGARFLTPACIAEHCGAPLCRHRPNRQISLQASYYQQSMAWTFCVQWPQVFICCTDLYIIQSLYDTACPPVEDS